MFLILFIFGRNPFVAPFNYLVLTVNNTKLYIYIRIFPPYKHASQKNSLNNLNMSKPV